MRSEMNREVEIKLSLKDAGQGRQMLASAGFHETKPRAFEDNSLFDTPEQKLKQADEALRLRACGGHNVLTFKGPAEQGPHKTREELETEFTDREAFEAILGRLGYRPFFRYQKFRTEYVQEPERGTAMLDETPIGVFLELEGPGAWIDETARALGYSETDYITKSYARLSSERGAGDMVFPS